MLALILSSSTIFTFVDTIVPGMPLKLAGFLLVTYANNSNLSPIMCMILEGYLPVAHSNNFDVSSLMTLSYHSYLHLMWIPGG